MTERLPASVTNTTGIQRFIWVCVRVLPVCAFSEFLFKRPNDDFLHSLIGLGDEVYGGAFCHDPYFTLPGFLNLLNKWNTIGT